MVGRLLHGLVLPYQLKAGIGCHFGLQVRLSIQIGRLNIDLKGVFYGLFIPWMPLEAKWHDLLHGTSREGPSHQALEIFELPDQISWDIFVLPHHDHTTHLRSSFPFSPSQLSKAKERVGRTSVDSSACRDPKPRPPARSPPLGEEAPHGFSGKERSDLCLLQSSKASFRAFITITVLGHRPKAKAAQKAEPHQGEGDCGDLPCDRHLRDGLQTHQEQEVEVCWLREPERQPHTPSSPSLSASEAAFHQVAAR